MKLSMFGSGNDNTQLDTSTSRAAVHEPKTTRNFVCRGISDRSDKRTSTSHVHVHVNVDMSGTRTNGACMHNQPKTVRRAASAARQRHSIARSAS